MDFFSRSIKMIAQLIFIKGSVGSELIAKEIINFSTMKQVGAHSIFIGQVRNDLIGGDAVQAIEYTAYEEMAKEKASEIIRTASGEFQLEEAKILHSIGKVKAGEICLFVIAVSKHRKGAIHGCEQIVERLKQELPIWGKEIFSDDSHQWKVNR